jgi:hypothetical protein
MKTLSALVIGVGLCCAVGHAQTYTQTAGVIASGATDAYNASHSMHIGATIGQSVIGITGNSVEQGFWHPDAASASAVELSQVGPPAGFLLDQNYPNPFNPMTLIHFSVPTGAHVALRVYTLTGDLVRTLVDDKLTPGDYNVRFNADGMAEGAYLYTLETNGHSVTKQMTLIK